MEAGAFFRSTGPAQTWRLAFGGAEDVAIGAIDVAAAAAAETNLFLLLSCVCPLLPIFALMSFL